MHHHLHVSMTRESQVDIYSVLEFRTLTLLQQQITVVANVFSTHRGPIISNVKLYDKKHVAKEQMPKIPINQFFKYLTIHIHVTYSAYK